MRTVIMLGSISQSTRSLYCTGTIIDGTKFQCPEHGWVYPKMIPGPQVDPAPMF